MKIRDIILDFTSLLDVIMIILFFFILFSHFESEEMKTQYDEQYEIIAEASEAADQKTAEAEEQLSMLADMDTDAAYNLKALMEFSRGTNLKAYLKMQESGWILEIRKKDEATKTTEILKQIANTDSISLEIRKLLYQKDYTPDDRILIEFIYNGSAPGTDQACEQILNALKEVRREYIHCYCAETDISVLESE